MSALPLWRCISGPEGLIWGCRPALLLIVSLDGSCAKTRKFRHGLRRKGLKTPCADRVPGFELGTHTAGGSRTPIRWPAGALVEFGKVAAAIFPLLDGFGQQFDEYGMVILIVDQFIHQC